MHGVSLLGCAGEGGLCVAVKLLRVVHFVHDVQGVHVDGGALTDLLQSLQAHGVPVQLLRRQVLMRRLDDEHVRECSSGDRLVAVAAAAAGAAVQSDESRESSVARVDGCCSRFVVGGGGSNVSAVVAVLDQSQGLEGCLEVSPTNAAFPVLTSLAIPRAEQFRVLLQLHAEIATVSMELQ